MSRYLVTGGAGFLGAPLVRSLVEAGHRVRVLDNLSRGSAERLKAVASDLEFISADIRDAERVRRAIRGVDAVCHLAYINGTEYFYARPAEVLDVGVKGIINVIDGCRHEEVRELILASTSEVYQSPPRVPTDETVPLTVPDPHNPRYSYGGGKIVTELMGIHYGREYFDRVLIFRPHNIFGPEMGWQHVIPQFVVRLLEQRRQQREGEVQLVIQGSGRQSRAFMYIEDFTAALMRLIERGEHLGIYNIGTTEEVTIEDLAQRIAAELGIAIRIVPGPDAPGGTQRRCPDVRKLDALGFAPRFTLSTALPSTVQWYREHFASAPASTLGSDALQLGRYA